MIEIIVIILIIIVCLIAISVTSTNTNPDPRFNYKNSNHKAWCDMLGTYANGIPRWHYSQSKTAIAMRDILDGTDGHKMTLITQNDEFYVTGLSGKKYKIRTEYKNNITNAYIQEVK